MATHSSIKAQTAKDLLANLIEGHLVQCNVSINDQPVTRVVQTLLEIDSDVAVDLNVVALRFCGDS